MKFLIRAGSLVLLAVLFLFPPIGLSQSGQQGWGGQPEATAFHERQEPAPVLRSQYRVSAHWLAAGIFLLVILVVLLLINIRQKIKANRQLSGQNKALQLARDELRQNLEKLESTNENLNNFLYAASHDLKESVRSMTSFGQLLERELSGGSLETAGHYAGYIIENGKRMDRTLEKLLFFSGLPAKEQLARAQVDLGKMAAQAWDELLKERNAPGGALTMGLLPQPVGDPTLINRLISCLLENAIEFRKDGQGLAVNLSFQKDAKAAPGCFVLEDNGQGVGKEYLESIFEPFKRLNPRGIGGAGLGLSICRRIVDLHRGSIWAETAGEDGLKVFFSLPISAGADSRPDGA